MLSTLWEVRGSSFHITVSSIDISTTFWLTSTSVPTQKFVPFPLGVFAPPGHRSHTHSTLIPSCNFEKTLSANEFYKVKMCEVILWRQAIEYINLQWVTWSASYSIFIWYSWHVELIALLLCQDSSWMMNKNIKVQLWYIYSRNSWCGRTLFFNVCSLSLQFHTVHIYHVIPCGAALKDDFIK